MLRGNGMYGGKRVQEHPHWLHLRDQDETVPLTGGNEFEGMHKEPLAELGRQRDHVK